VSQPAFEAIDELVARDDLHISHEGLRIAQPTRPRVRDHGEQDLLPEVIPLLLEIVGAQLCEETRQQAVELEKRDPIAREQPFQDGVPVPGSLGHRRPA
jgi:hypothetical protein